MAISLNDVQRGYDAWAAKPHNAKWVRKIDGTPIANDIVVNIFEALKSHPVAVKGLEWVEHPNAFPAPTWSAQTGFGFYNIEEISASDSPVYEVRLHAHHLIAAKDSLEEAKEVAQADYERRIRTALVAMPHDQRLEARATAAEATVTALQKALKVARAEEIEDVLGALTAHELYQYRPKAFQGFIEYARKAIATIRRTPHE